MRVQLTPRSLFPGKRSALSVSRSAVVLHSQSDCCSEKRSVLTWPGDEPRIFCFLARGVVTEPTELFRPLYFIVTSEQSLEIRVNNQAYP